MHGMTPNGMVLDNGKPIVAVDIDGTLADYHGWFLKFASDYLGKPMPDADAMNPGLPLHQFMGLDKETYRAVKLAYRQGGFKRTMPAFPGASDLTREIEAAGAEVWICTTRPYLRLDNIDPDTREWLERNDIQYTALTYGDNKYENLVEYVGRDRIVAVVEDLPEQIEKARALGLNLYVPDRPYNKTIENRFHSLCEIGDLIVSDLDRWKKNKESNTVQSEPPPSRDSLKAPFGTTFGTEGYFQKSQSIPLADSDYERDREARWASLMDEAFELFIKKSRDYGKTGDTLGARGQFADMWRKFGKIKHQVWDHPERAVHFEGVEEILKDLIGHAILFLDYMERGNK